jgi:hypothetical protein
MNQLSNDIKWNKIRAIEKELSRLYYDYCSSHGFGEDAHKIAKREVWILANKIYDIATEGLEKDRYWDCFPEHWSSLLERINRVCSSKNPEYSDKYKQQTIEDFWSKYDYANS